MKLPAPKTKGGMPLVEALATRRSVRDFARRPLTAEQISQLCWAAQGITEPTWGYRTAPSAGALYPLTLLVATSEGVFAYLPREHALKQLLSTDVRRQMEVAALHQEWVGSAPAVFVICADISITAAKYGRRAERYVWLEVGHAAQNILLQATALGLGAVPVGAYEDAAIAKILHLPANLRVMYLVPVGYPR